jgi:hypothetical protein
MFRFRIPIFASGLTLMLLISATTWGQGPSSGANVNMVSGTDWTTGDPFLQRQNEPSIAVSTRNPLHLLAGANDYRTVDLAGLLGIEERGDAWLGVFKSFDGGQTWQSTLLPGYPLDSSADGIGSPLRGLQAGADPAVRAGTNGLFYYSGIAFNRGTNAPSSVFVARFIDNDNRENGDATRQQSAITNVVPADSIRFLGQTVVGQGSSSVFLDKPWLAVDVPRGTATCTINFTNPDGSLGTETVPAGMVFMSYSAFDVPAPSTSDDGGHHGSDQDDDDRRTGSKILFARSTDCGKTFGLPVKLASDTVTNQGSVIAVDPSSASLAVARLYVVWRRFADATHPGGMVIAKSIDGGQTFSVPRDVVSFPATCLATPTGTGCPIDQGLSAATPFGGSFRSNTYPTVAVDDNGRVYVAWSQRQANGDARIVMSVSGDGLTWPAAGTPVDLGQVPDDLGNAFPNLSNPSRGHQLMPSLSFNAGKLMLAYYDLRLDHTLGVFTPSADQKSYLESRQLMGELDPTSGSFNPDAVFNTFISDGPLTTTTTLTVRRHTIDVEGAQASPLPAGNVAVPSFTSFRISRYQFGINPFDSTSTVEQLQLNTPNLPLFVQGTQPFIGDYIDVAGSPTFVFSNGKWNFNTTSSSNPMFHAVWTDNRDVRPPADGNWTSYTPPFSASNPAAPHTSVFDPTQTVPTCTDDNHSGMRNQNIYTSRVAPGIYVAAPGNSKSLGFIPNSTTLLTRMFAVTVQNTTALEKSFRITVANQPLLADGTVDPVGTASLQQFGPLMTTEDVTTSAGAGVSRPVFVQSANPSASVTVTIQEITAPGGTLVSGGLQASTALNPDPTAPQIIDPDNPAILNPAILNAEVYNPAILNPAILNPAILNPAILNPAILNPAILNPAILNPALSAALNPAILNPAILNPAILNPAILNPALADQTVTDATYTIVNNGNTVGSYAVKLFGTQPAGTTLQLILSKTYLTPVSQNCQLASQSQNTVQVSVPDPVIENANTLADPELPNSSTKNATINLRPGETALVTLRANVTTAAALQDIVNNLTPVVVSHAANTGATTPPATLAITTTSGTLTAGVQGVGYSATLSSFGGNAPAVWALFSGSLPPGLALDPTTGIIFGTPTASGSFSFTVSLTDSSAPTPTTARRALTLTVAVPLVITTTSLNDGITGITYSQILAATGGNSIFTWSLASGTLPPGLQLSPAGIISGTPTTAGNSSFVVQVQDTGTPQQTKTQSLSIRVAAPLVTTIASLPPANVGIAYSQTLTATGGIAPLTWSLATGSGPLPGGLALSSAGVISGTPNATGTFSFTVQVADSSLPKQVATKAFTLTVAVLYNVTFYVQPSNSSPNTQITPAIKVLVTDASSKGVSGVLVTVTIAVNPGGGTLGGKTADVTGNNGIAILSSNSINKTGTGYVLKATTNLAGAGTAFSVPFNIR